MVLYLVCLCVSAGANVTSLLGSERLLGIMSMPKAASKLRLDFSNLLGPLVGV